MFACWGIEPKTSALQDLELLVELSLIDFLSTFPEWI